MLALQEGGIGVARATATWMLLEGASARRGRSRPYSTRFESLGLKLPEHRLGTDELMASTRHHPHIELERLTGIHERHVCSEGEDSFTLAVGAARDCLEHSSYEAHDIEMLISCSISKNKGGLHHHFEPPLSLSIKEAIGAGNALSFDLSNACAGMMSGVLVLHDFIRRGVIKRGMVVSGEYISSLGTNAAKQIRSILSTRLASLTLGDAGAAVVVERAPEGAPAISVAGFTTLSEYSRLCLGAPADVGPGASMTTRARTIHRAAVADSPPLLKEALDASGLDFGQIDHVIPHQTSARAIRIGAREISEELGVAPGHVVSNVFQFGNTASTTHFVALYRYLSEGRFKKGDRIMLISFASGLEVGVVIFEMDGLVDRYGRAD